jgi:hypothetical protein
MEKELRLLPRDLYLALETDTSLFAGLAVSGGERRRRRAAVWAQALDRWLTEQRRRYGSQAAEQAEADWQLIYENIDRLPWELTHNDIAAHAAWMDAHGYSLPQIVSALESLDAFYEWRRLRCFDAECPDDFNPARPPLEFARFMLGYLEPPAPRNA